MLKSLFRTRAQAESEALRRQTADARDALRQEMEGLASMLKEKDTQHASD